jgi:hypothetical protein
MVMEEGVEEEEEEEEDEVTKKRNKERRKKLRKAIRTRLLAVSKQVDLALVKEYRCAVDKEFLKLKSLLFLSNLDAFICKQIAVCDSQSDDDAAANNPRIRRLLLYATWMSIQAVRCLHLSLFAWLKIA